MKKGIKIEGMMCDNCAKHVKKTLESIDGIKKAKVSLKDKKAIVELNDDVEDDKIKNKIDEIGYKVVNIEKL